MIYLVKKDPEFNTTMDLQLQTVPPSTLNICFRNITMMISNIVFISARGFARGGIGLMKYHSTSTTQFNTGILILNMTD